MATTADAYNYISLPIISSESSLEELLDTEHLKSNDLYTKYMGSVELENRDGKSLHSEDFETELEHEIRINDNPEEKRYWLEDCLQQYEWTCTKYKICKSARLVDSLSHESIDLANRSMGEQSGRAVAAALKGNLSVEKLDLQGNDLGGQGTYYICHMMKRNETVKVLNLSKNKVGTLGACAIGDMMSLSKHLLQLDISANNLQDSDAKYIAVGIEKNDSIEELNLSHNNFREEGAIHIGEAIGNNVSITHLDLSWNQIRKKGSVSICNALQRNFTLSHVDLSWNGFGYEGSLAICEVLKTNRYITQLDLSNNRIGWDGAHLIAAALKENSTLEVFKMGHNPLTTTGCMDIIEAVENPCSRVIFLSFDSVPINRKVAYTAENVNKLRDFTLEHGGVLEGDDSLGKRKVLRVDPLKLLLQFLQDHGIRPVDLFRTFDKEDQQRVTRGQFIKGLKKARVPLDDYEIERLLNRLDANREGYISYPRLVKGVKEQITENREEEKKRRSIEEKRKAQHDRILQSGLPSISENNTPRLVTSIETESSSTMGGLNSVSQLIVPEKLGTTSMHSLLTSSVRDMKGQQSKSLSYIPGKINMSSPLTSHSSQSTGKTTKKKKKKSSKK